MKAYLPGLAESWNKDGKQWGLPKDYPKVAPNYAAARSNLAKQSGLGQGGRKPAGKAR